MKKKFGFHKRSNCPIANTLDIVGDKWSLIIIRDMLNGKKRYGEFQDSPEGIPTNILASRLRQMTALGLVAKMPYQKHPPRFEYSLTKKGRALIPVVQEICRFGNAHIPKTWVPPESFMELRP